MQAIEREFDQSLQALIRASGELPNLFRMGEALADRIREGGRFFVAGNGGSHSLAEHFCGEMVGRFRYPRDPIGAMVLQGCAAVGSALSNDFGFDVALERELSGVVSERDLVILISGSGESQNLIHAAHVAKRRAAALVCLVGDGSSTLAELGDYVLSVPDVPISIVQQVHLVFLHLLCVTIEEDLRSDFPL